MNVRQMIELLQQVKDQEKELDIVIELEGTGSVAIELKVDEDDDGVTIVGTLMDEW